MHSFRADFPVFAAHPGLVYLDNASTTQKPQSVIDAVTHYLSTTNANIHRGSYRLAQESEELYLMSKQRVAHWIGAKSSEIIYTHHATHAVNIVAQALVASKCLDQGDEVLVGLRDHHATIVPWQLLGAQHGFVVKFIPMMQDGSIDWQGLEQLMSDRVRVVACSMASNVTGRVYPVRRLRDVIGPERFFMIDASQAVGHIPCRVEDLGCDAMVWTGHKIYAMTGIGVLYLRKHWIKELQTTYGGGGMIQDVTVDGTTVLRTLEKFEPGTPNVVGAVSLDAALQYLEGIGGYEVIQRHEQELMQLIVDGFAARTDRVRVFGSLHVQERVGVFAFGVVGADGQAMVAREVGERMAAADIAIRCGGHCAHPLIHWGGQGAVCRASIGISTTSEDVERLWEVLDEVV